jgi:hypothetical protein
LAKAVLGEHVVSKGKHMVPTMFSWKSKWTERGNKLLVTSIDKIYLIILIVHRFVTIFQNKFLKCNCIDKNKKRYTHIVCKKEEINFMNTLKQITNLGMKALA